MAQAQTVKSSQSLSSNISHQLGTACRPSLSLSLLYYFILLPSDQARPGQARQVQGKARQRHQEHLYRPPVVDQSNPIMLRFLSRSRPITRLKAYIACAHTQPVQNQNSRSHPSSTSSTRSTWGKHLLTSNLSTIAELTPLTSDMLLRECVYCFV